MSLRPLVAMAPGNPRPRQVVQKFSRAWERTNLPDLPDVCVLVRSLQPSCLLRREAAPGLTQEGVHEQSAAHSDPPVDAPHGQFNARHLQRVPPGENVLINAIYQSTVEVKQKRWPRRRLL